MIRLIFVALLLFPFSAQAVYPLQPMRGFIWGVGMEDVRAAEAGVPAGEDENNLFYMDELSLPRTYRPGETAPERQVFKMLIQYHFTRNRLDQVRYDFVLTGITHPAQVMDRAMTVQLWLDTAFAQVSEPVFNFRNPKEEKIPARWPWAIIRGEGSMRIAWQNENTTARLSLTGEEYEAQLDVVLGPRQNRTRP